MIAELFGEAWFLWSVGLILGFQLLVVVLGEVAQRQARRGSARAGITRLLRNVLIPLLVLLLFARHVVGLSSGATTVRLLETALWIAALFAALSALNVFVFREAEEGSWRERVPGLFLDLLRLFVVALGGVLVLSVVWGRDVGGLLAALGVGSIVLGLALQDTLGSLMSGIAMLFERPFQIGDWIKFGDREGEVVEMNWRSVHLRTRERDLLVVPNAVLGKELIVNTCAPTREHAEVFHLSFSFEDPPNRVREVIAGVAMGVDSVAPEPEPKVEVVAYDEGFIRYEAKLYVTDLLAIRRIRDEFATRVWYASRREGLTLGRASRWIHAGVEARAADAGELEARLARVPAFARLGAELRAELAGAARSAHYARGERILRAGETSASLLSVAAGRVGLVTTLADGTRRALAQLGPGDVFGAESVLGGEPAPCDAVADGDAQILILEGDAVRGVLDRSPATASELAGLVDRRLVALRRASSELAGIEGGARESAEAALRR